MGGLSIYGASVVPAVKKMRLFLIILGILYTYGIHPALGDLSGVILGFAIPALYMISGCLVLRDSPNIEKRILRTIGRTAICFAILFAVYFALSLIVSWETTVATVCSRAFWINFLIFNVWTLPVGSTIWFVQALLYAYIIIYVIYKLKLLRFDIIIAALCLAVTLLTGELASVVGFYFRGRTYIGGNFFTRALPYILIGCFIYRKRDFFGTLKMKYYVLTAGAGAALIAAEYIVLEATGYKYYVGHLLGMGLVAAAVCMFCLFVEGMEFESELFRELSRFEISIPYYICSPLNVLFIYLISMSERLYGILGGFIGIITAVFGVIALFIYYYCIRPLFFAITRRGEQ